MAGQAAFRADISGMTNAEPCVITTSAAHGYSTNQFVRITDINGSIPTLRGMDQINNKKFRIIKINATSFSLEDATTFEKINSTGFTPYVTGGFCNLVEPTYIYSGD